MTKFFFFLGIFALVLATYNFIVPRPWSIIFLVFLVPFGILYTLVGLAMWMEDSEKLVKKK